MEVAHHSKNVRIALGNSQSRRGLGELMNKFCGVVIRVDLPNLWLANYGDQDLAISSESDVFDPLCKSTFVNYLLPLFNTECKWAYSSIGELVNSLDQGIRIAGFQRRSSNQRTENADKKRDCWKNHCCCKCIYTADSNEQTTEVAPSSWARLLLYVNGPENSLSGHRASCLPCKYLVGMNKATGIAP